jgi:hypothetical protein
MKFKTTIEVVTEADNVNDAMDVVDEYLSGNVISGIDMKCTTKRVYSYNRSVVAISVASALLLAGVLSLVHFGTSQKTLSYLPTVSAVQTPLKTSSTGPNSAEFKKEWEKKQTKEALDLIKNSR